MRPYYEDMAPWCQEEVVLAVLDHAETSNSGIRYPRISPENGPRAVREQGSFSYL